MAVDRRNSTKAAKLSSNPLFRAINTSRGLTGPATHNANHNHHHITKRREPYKAINSTSKVNELQQRLGLASTPRHTGNQKSRNNVPVHRNVQQASVPKAIASNPLAAALGMVKPGSSQSSADPRRRNVNGRGGLQPIRGGRAFRNNTSVKTRYRENEKPSNNETAAITTTKKGDNRQAVVSSTSDDNKINLNFKNASLIPFLRIENLEPTVNETDIRMVLSRSMGPTLKILKMNTLFNGEPSVTAEVFFLNEEKLTQYADTLNGLKADGHNLKATIAYHSNIINSEKLWEAVLKEVRYIKQEVTRHNLEQRMMAQVPGTNSN